LYYTASGIITPVGGRTVHMLREDQSKFKRYVLKNESISKSLNSHINCLLYRFL